MSKGTGYFRWDRCIVSPNNPKYDGGMFVGLYTNLQKSWNVRLDRSKLKGTMDQKDQRDQKRSRWIKKDHYKSPVGGSGEAAPAGLLLHWFIIMIFFWDNYYFFLSLFVKNSLNVRHRRVLWLDWDADSSNDWLSPHVLLLRTTKAAAKSVNTLANHF